MVLASRSTVVACAPRMPFRYDVKKLLAMTELPSEVVLATER
jgi:hypothetical protein